MFANILCVNLVIILDIYKLLRSKKEKPGGFSLPKYMYIGRMKNGKTF